MNNSEAPGIWRAAIEALRPEVGDANVDLWLKPVEAVSLANGLLKVAVPNKMVLDWIRAHCQARLEGSLASLAGGPVALDFQVRESAPPPPSPAQAFSPAQPDIPFSELNPRYTFDSFVVGAHNRYAHAMAEAVCKSPGRQQMNPFFIYGGVGLGKTHLMHAIGHEIRRTHARARVLYATAEQFTNEFINSIKDNKPDNFRGKYRNLDCLMVDDVQFLIAKEKSEEEFFHTFNTLFESRKQIVISSDRAPKEMAPQEQRLISRFLWGQVVDIRAPDRETRIAILRKKAETDGLFVPDDVIVFLAETVKTNIRELEGSLNRLGFLSAQSGSLLTVDAAREFLADLLGPEAAPTVAVETIQKIVARRYNLDVRDLKSQSRTSEVVLPRQLAMYLCGKMTGLSTKSIGSHFGDRDHSTVVHSQKKIEGMIQSDLLFLEVVNKLMEDIRLVDNR